MFTAFSPRVFKRAVLVTAISTGSAIALSSLWNIPYIYTLIGCAAWILLNEVVVDEDELITGGVIDMEGCAFSLRPLMFKAMLLCALCFLALQFPALRNWGA
jgi:hypothetical protein